MTTMGEMIHAACDHLGEDRDKSFDRQYLTLQLDAKLAGFPYDERAVEEFDRQLFPEQEQS